MSDVSQQDGSEIGVIAGLIWTYLQEHGSVSLSRLVKDIEQPRDRVMQAVGWLAREDKISFQRSNRGRQVGLKS